MIRYHYDIEQGTPEWLSLRCGILTASEIKLIITPTLKVASNDKERAHLLELLAQRITGYTEPRFVSDDMLRGHEDEIEARIKYAEHYAPVKECGFITRNMGGIVIGYSPDGLVGDDGLMGDDGLIECKSRRQKYQVETILSGEVPAEYMLQIQTGLLVSGRKWLDFVSYSAGLPMFVKRVLPDERYRAAIIAAATEFESRLQMALSRYQSALKSMPILINTERKIEEEMYL